MRARSRNKATKSNTVGATRRHQRQAPGAPEGKLVSSDQAPGEETVQVNDKYTGGGPAPSVDPADHFQHQTGG